MMRRVEVVEELYLDFRGRNWHVCVFVAGPHGNTLLDSEFGICLKQGCKDRRKEGRKEVRGKKIGEEEMRENGRGREKAKFFRLSRLYFGIDKIISKINSIELD